MNITQRQLLMFTLVASVQSVSRASTLLGLSQPALSRALQDFEAQLEVKLFSRTTRSIVLTPEGKRFLPVVQRLLGDLKHAVESLRHEKDELGGSVTIAAGTSFACSVMPAVLRDFAQKHPAVRVQLQEDTSTGIMAKALRGEIDFGVGDKAGESDVLEFKHLLDAPVGVLFNPEHFRVPQRPQLSRLSKLPLVRETGDVNVINLLRLHGADVIAVMEVGFEVSSLSLQLALTRTGAGVAILSALGASHPLAQDLQFAPIAPVAKREVFLTYRKDRHVRPAARALIDCMLDALPKVELNRLVRRAPGP